MSIYTKLISTPVIGTFIYITNAYAYRGDYASSEKFAGFNKYIKAFAIQIIIAMVLTMIVVSPLTKKLWDCGILSTVNLSDFSKKPGDVILSSIPSLLGFGIGVYGLIFALSPKFVKFLEKSIKDSKEKGEIDHGSELMINSNFAYPLVILTLTLGIGVFQKSSDSPILLLICWTFFWYALILILEVVGVIFGLGDHSLLDKSKEVDS